MNTPAPTDMREATALQVGTLAADLFRAHYDAIGREMEQAETNKLSVGLTYKVRQTSDGLSLKAKISFGAKHTDEAEANVSDPKQSKLL